MLYRIDYQNYLLHMIDYFTPMELSNILYAIVSGKIRNGGKTVVVSSCLQMYPTVEMIQVYTETQNKEILYKMYKELLESSEYKHNKQHVGEGTYAVYQTFVKPVLDHYDICIICDRNENEYIDCLVRYIKEKFDLETIDLNVLFKKGKIGPIYIDRKEIHDECVNMNRIVMKTKFDSMASTENGRMELISKMSKKEKLKRLNDFGVTPMKDDNINELLLDAWNESLTSD